MTGSAGQSRPPARERAPAARPPGLAPECARLAEELRELRKRTGLSLAALAERTAYSKSSWERYLNGKKQVPRQAVEALCRLAGERPDRLLVLWDLADAEWSGRGAFGSAAPRAPGGGPRPAHGRTAGERSGAGVPAAAETGPADAGPGGAESGGVARGNAGGTGTRPAATRRPSGSPARAASGAAGGAPDGEPDGEPSGATSGATSGGAPGGGAAGGPAAGTAGGTPAWPTAGGRPGASARQPAGTSAKPPTEAFDGTAAGETDAGETHAGETAAGRPGNREAGGAVAGRPAGSPAAPGAGSRLLRWPYATRRWTALLAALCATAAVAGVLALGGIRPGGTERQAAAEGSASAAPSLPPPGCRGAACDGKDPESMGCGITVRTLGGHRTARGAGMEIRYSERCGAAWARIWQSRVGDRVRITAPGGRFQQATVADRYDAEGYVYTPMIGAGERSALSACHIPAPGGERECFDTTTAGEETEDPPAAGDAT